jgi:hypothetical protein
MRYSCVLGRCVPVLHAFEHAVTASPNCDGHCPPLESDEYFALAKDWSQFAHSGQDDLVIAAPPAAEATDSGTWLLQAQPAVGSHAHVDDWLKLKVRPGVAAQLIHRWHAPEPEQLASTSDKRFLGYNQSDMSPHHIVKYPHPYHGPGCDPTPPPTAPTPGPTPKCSRNLCAGNSETQYPVQRSVQVEYSSNFTVPPLPETFNPDEMTLYL